MEKSTVVDVIHNITPDDIEVYILTLERQRFSFIEFCPKIVTLQLKQLYRRQQCLSTCNVKALMFMQCSFLRRRETVESVNWQCCWLVQMLRATEQKGRYFQPKTRVTATTSMKYEEKLSLSIEVALSWASCKDRRRHFYCWLHSRYNRALQLRVYNFAGCRQNNGAASTCWLRGIFAVALICMYSYADNPTDRQTDRRWTAIATCSRHQALWLSIACPKNYTAHRTQLCLASVPPVASRLLAPVSYVRTALDDFLLVFRACLLQTRNAAAAASRLYGPVWCMASGQCVHCSQPVCVVPTESKAAWCGVMPPALSASSAAAATASSVAHGCRLYWFTHFAAGQTSLLTVQQPAAVIWFS